MDRERLKQLLKESLKQRETQILVVIMAFAVIFELYYFFRLGQQPVWWDEGDYLAIAKVWAIGMPTPEWWGHFTTIRPLLLPIIWMFLFKIGSNELLVRFITLLLPSLVTIYLVYAVGRDLYNKKVGLIASLMISVYWVFVFYSFRLLTDIPAMSLGMLSLYFFWSQYITKNKNSGLYLSILFGVLAFTARFALALVLISIVIYLLFVKKLTLFKEKTTWKAAGFGLICLSPYLIYFLYTKFGLFSMYFGKSAVSIKTPLITSISQFMNLIPELFDINSPFLPSPLNKLWFFFLILGLFLLISFFIYLDILWKQKDKKFNADLFVFIFILVHVVFYVFILRAANDRWILMLMPALFFVTANGMLFVYNLIRKYEKTIALIVLLAIILLGAYQQYQHASWLIEQKKDSYREIKIAGEWLKQNTPKDTKIITASIVQNQYYSERQSYDFHTNDSIWIGCTDIYGAVSLNESCQLQTEAAFNNKVALLKPDYMIVSAFEPVFTPNWTYAYPEKYNLTFVKGFMNQNKEPTLIIYQF